MKLRDEFLQHMDAVSFPAPPAVVLRLSQLLAREGTTADELAEAIALDAGMSAKVLRLANSVMFGGSGQVETIQEAVLRAGVDGVRDIVFALALVGAMKPANFEYRPFWRHSLAVANAAQILLNRSTSLAGLCPEAYAAGLLHDIGMLVFDRALGAKYGEVLAAARDSGRPLCDVERELVGLEHGEIGARVMELWQLPPPIIDAARLHHTPWLSRSLVTQLVHLADFICNNQGLHHGTGYFPEHPAPEVWEELGIPDRLLPQVIVAVQAELQRAEAILEAAG